MPVKDTNKQPNTETAVVAAPAEKAAQLPPAALGAVINVKVAEGQKLRNNETGAFFEEDKATPQTVTVTTLRRLEDGCLVQVA
ncbi:MAG: hypothetical protein V4451_05925 [Pseudomonadota bacterium]